MEKIFPQRPFVEQLEFIGSLNQGDISADGLNVILQYSLIKENEITGSILGTRETFSKIKKVFDLPGPTLQMHSQEREPWNKIITSDIVICERISNHPDYPLEMLFKIADLRLDNLTIKETFSLDDLKERHLDFFLCGPSNLWNVIEIGGKSFNGEEKIEVKNSKIELSEAFPFDIEVKPSYFYDETAPPESFQIKTSVFVLHFKTLLPATELSNEEFIKRAIFVTEELTQLVSFLSRRWATWFRYKLITNKLSQTHIRHARECSSQAIHYDNAIVPFHQAREFLNIAFTNLKKLRDSQIDLHMPLVYFVSGLEAKYVEEKFSVLFLALERIKDLFANENGMLNNLANSHFRRLRCKLSDLIKNEIIDQDIADKVKKKLPELNRPSLRIVLEALFDKYKVDWKDLYPPGIDFTLLKTRDNLFHSSKEIDYDYLIKETHRLQALLERVLLSMLGWPKFRNSPNEYKKKWLNSNA
jgi:hypothetical protein